jgi:two-component system, response regulator YesN
MYPVTVVIVDDEELIRKGIARLIEKSGNAFEIIGTYSSAREALELLDQVRVDLLITDIRMPEMDGLELIAAAKWRHPKLFSMVISGYEEFEYARKAIKLGVTDYILKPVDRKQFREQLSHVIDAIMDLNKTQYLHRDLENEYIRTTHLKVESYLNSAVYTNRTFHSSEWEKLSVDPDSRYRLISVSLDRVQKQKNPYSERDYELFDYALMGIVHDLCGEWEKSMPAGLQLHKWKGIDGWGWILISLTDKREESALNPPGSLDHPDITHICEQLSVHLQQAFRAYLPIQVSMGVSSELEEMATIGQAAAEARASLQRRLFEGGGKCFWWENQLEALSLESRCPAKRGGTHSLENKLLNQVRISDEPAIRDIVDELFANWKENGASSSTLPAYVLSLMLRGNALIEELRMEEEEQLLKTHHIENLWRKMQASSDVLELKDELLKVLLLITGKIKSLRNGTDKEPIEKAKEYIERNITGELPLSAVAAKVYLNPSYLSNLFKIQTGENFLNYVTRVRMEKAMELLRETDRKPGEVAGILGYQNPKYFTKVFKEFSGLTPTDYRDLHLHNPKQRS